MHRLQVGIISETLFQQRHLSQIVEKCGFQVGVAWLVEQTLQDFSLLSRTKRVDVWLANVNMEALQQNKDSQIFERWLFDLKQPVIFGEGSAGNIASDNLAYWTKQLSKKLLSVSSQLTLANQQQRAAHYIWILAASTGGPEAVKQFLDHLPTGLDVSFLYAQHIESKQNMSLSQTLVRNSKYTCRIAQHGNILTADTITIAPNKQQLDLLLDGTIILRSQPWRGEHNPSIDQVTAAVGQCFGPRSGAIFFTGMGEDGTMGARLMARRSGKIWTQSIESCISDSMPNAVNRTGTVTVTGTPAQLANYLERELKSTPLPTATSS
ncbi:MAG: chemosensory pili system protein ChpB (putative protein-glutamate methylesterase) [Cellvibrionaceae bacterium]